MTKLKESKRLRRRCSTCKQIFDVFRPTDKISYDGFSGTGTIYVNFTSDPFEEEIRSNFTKMWLCSRCCYNSSMDI